MSKWIAAVCLLGLAPVVALAQGAARELTFEVEATVTEIDAESRTVVLENASTGETESIIAGPEVVNFDQIEVGDTVRAAYTVGIAARLAEPGEIDTVTEIGARAAEGDKPGAAGGTIVTLVLEFVSFDPASSVATVKTSDGVEERIEVASDEGRAFAESLSAGDKVALTFTEGVAVGIVQD